MCTQKEDHKKNKKTGWHSYPEMVMLHSWQLKKQTKERQLEVNEGTCTRQTLKDVDTNSYWTVKELSIYIDQDCLQQKFVVSPVNCSLLLSLYNNIILKMLHYLCLTLFYFFMFQVLYYRHQTYYIFVLFLCTLYLHWFLISKYNIT